MTPQSRPRLAPKARLRFDRKAERFMLLYPERGLALNPTAADILKLCTGEHTVSGIAAELATRYTEPQESVEHQVLQFLGTMAERGLVQDSAS